jgi:Kyakuja-Dileera-Zisupton transposase
MATKACDITGIVAIACARHGCFVPNTFADMYLGEQQKNVDFSLLRLIKVLGLDPEQGLFFIYDIVCQYIINLLKRIGKDLPENLTIEKAIDLFHVHCHKDECFFRYATTFIPGAGIVAAQILESLWSTLNTISPKLRTATLPHRAEALDDHACDSNNKKLLAMTDTLRGKFLDAKVMTVKAEENYTKIVRTVDPVTLNIWEQQILRAESERADNISAMDIYQAKIPGPIAGPESRDSLESETDSRDSPGSGIEPTPQEQWMEFALLVEDTQLV